MALLVMMGIAGAAIDYVRLVEQRTVFAAAADSAVLAAISSAREAERKSLSGIPALAKKAAQAAWDRNIATTTLNDLKGPKITISKAGSAWTAKVAYNEDSPATFVSLLGIKSMKVAGESAASTTVEKNPNFWDFHIVIDTSSSMGIGATEADMSALEAHPDIGCAFACHSADYAKGATDSAKIAQNAGIKLRINIVDDAVDAMIEQLKLASSGVLPALKACATDGLFFNATTPASFTAAMQDMLKAAMGLGTVPPHRVAADVSRPPCQGRR